MPNLVLNLFKQEKKRERGSYDEWSQMKKEEDTRGPLGPEGNQSAQRKRERTDFRCFSNSEWK